MVWSGTAPSEEGVGTPKVGGGEGRERAKERDGDLWELKVSLGWGLMKLTMTG